MFASPWLFQYLTETLDRRMLAVLGNRNFDGLPHTISLNLNVSTVLSRDFHKFHQAVGKNTAKVVVEMQVLDIFADMSTFGYARDSLQERGYRVVVDGLNPLALQFIDPGLLRSDFVKINWDKDYEGDVDPARQNDMRAVVTSTGADSVILARVDTEEAVKWGVALGISQFQGYFVDDLLEKIADVQEQQEKAKEKAQ
ncbi:MAG TPA: EAL domain-containing protein, partial [Rhodospirillales bacterium]|nr:EAL domain-containing protein [Rhodospirillales bacterium]